MTRLKGETTGGGGGSGMEGVQFTYVNSVKAFDPCTHKDTAAGRRNSSLRAPFFRRLIALFSHCLVVDLASVYSHQPANSFVTREVLGMRIAPSNTNRRVTPKLPSFEVFVQCFSG